MKKYLGILFAIFLTFCITFAPFTKSKAEVITGSTTGWSDYWSNPPFRFDDHISVETHIEAKWSIHHSDLDGIIHSGWFYGYNETTEIALTDATSISDITDASTYTYSNWSVGPVYEGDIVVFHNLDTNYYAAFLVVDYGPKVGAWGTVDVIWYFQDDGTGNFN